MYATIIKKEEILYTDTIKLKFENVKDWSLVPSSFNRYVLEFPEPFEVLAKTKIEKLKNIPFGCINIISCYWLEEFPEFIYVSYEGIRQKFPQT